MNKLQKLFTLALAFTLSLTISKVSAADEVRATMTQQQLISLQQASKAPAFTLLDVRSAEEYQAGHIKGAINIAHSELANKLAMLPLGKSDMVVVYCRSGRRAGVAEGILKANGYTKVKHLAGDMNGWLAADLPIAK